MFFKMAWNELKLISREPMTLFFTLAFPLILLVVFGVIFGNQPDEMFGGHGMIDISVPAYMGVIIGTTGLLTLPITLANYREQGVLRRFRITPMQPLMILAVQIVVNLLLSSIGAVLLIIAAALLYHLALPQNILGVLLAFVVGTLSFCTLSFVVAGLVPNSRAAQAVGMAILFPMMFLAGAAMPREMLPDIIQKLSLALPLTHVILLLRSIWFDGTWNLPSLLVLAALIVVGALVSTRIFRWE